MRALSRTLTSTFFVLFACQWALAAVDCHNVNSQGATPLQAVTLPPQQVCTQRVVPSGLILPDPACTPGAINPTVTINVLQDPNYRTSCTRDGATSAAQKNQTYTWYGLPHPANNTGANQFCELDHLISLELGGADTLENIWPQCGPDKVTLRQRYFKQKDAVENYLAAQVRAGAMSLYSAQWGIANDWTQYLAAATGGPLVATVGPPFGAPFSTVATNVVPSSQLVARKTRVRSGQKHVVHRHTVTTRHVKKRSRARLPKGSESISDRQRRASLPPAAEGQQHALPFCRLSQEAPSGRPCVSAICRFSLRYRWEA
jgi:hypothetical protein